MKAKEAEKLFEKFTGRESLKDSIVELAPMDNLSFLGECVAVEYQAKKHKDRKAHVYRHEFKPGSILVTNGKELLIIGPFKIESRGIVG
jgi:hypothetical protein